MYKYFVVLFLFETRKNFVRMIKNCYQLKRYKISIKQNKKSSQIKMEMPLCCLSTEHLPFTKTILNILLPHIFRGKCFNDGELPFRIEVENTETGHLFEHILLEYLCDYKIKLGAKTVTFCGETQWNWKKEKRGIFNITVNTCDEDVDIFYPALEKSIELFDFILENGQRNFTNNTFNNWYYLLAVDFLAAPRLDLCPPFFPIRL